MQTSDMVVLNCNHPECLTFGARTWAYLADGTRVEPLICVQQVQKTVKQAGTRLVSLDHWGLQCLVRGIVEVPSNRWKELEDRGLGHVWHTFNDKGGTDGHWKWTTDDMTGLASSDELLVLYRELSQPQRDPATYTQTKMAGVIDTTEAGFNGMIRGDTDAG